MSRKRSKTVVGVWMPPSSVKKKGKGSKSGARHLGALIPLNTNKITASYKKKCEKARKDYEKTRIQLDFYEKNEKPAFVRWYRSEFGAKEIEISEIEREINKKRQLWQALRYRWRIGRFRNKHDCYKVYMKELQDEELARQNEKFQDTSKDFDDDDFHDGDAEDFQSGDSRDGDHKKTYGKGYGKKSKRGEKSGHSYKSFEDFIKDLLGYGEEEDEEFYDDDEKAFEEAIFGARKGRDDEIKSVYRTICRKLHPDTGVEFDDATSSLWHDAQDAYQVGDLESLKNILAVCEMNCPVKKKTMSCSQILSVMKHYKDGKSSLSYILRRSKKEGEWGFLSWDEEKKRKFKSGTESSLEAQIAEKKRLVDFYEKELRTWTEPPKAPMGEPPYVYHRQMPGGKKKVQENPMQTVFDFDFS